MTGRSGDGRPGDAGSGGRGPEEWRRQRRQGLAYAGAFEAVVAILVAAGIGYWIDGRYDTSPAGLLIGTAVGFASFVLRLLRLGRQLQELSDPERDEEGRR